jgi:hypothetical protein
MEKTKSGLFATALGICEYRGAISIVAVTGPGGPDGACQRLTGTPRPARYSFICRMLYLPK